MKKPAINHFETVVRFELDRCRNAEEMLTVLAHSYDLKKPMGSITRLAFIQGLRMAVGMLNPEVVQDAATN